MSYSDEWATPRYAPRRRRVGGGTWLFFFAALAAIGGLGYFGALPAWAHWPASLTQQMPNGPEVAYPVFGSDELVLYLARSMVAQQESITVTRGMLPEGDINEGLSDAMYEALVQNPYVFADGWHVTISGVAAIVKPDYLYDATEAESRRAQTAAALQTLVIDSGALSAASQTDAVAALHDAIAGHASYDWDASAAISSGTTGIAISQSQEAYGILVGGTAVCTGYAQTMQLAAQAIGVDSVVVTGVATSGVTTGGHAWNRVNIDGVWRAVDVTWDDATVMDGAEVVTHEYLLLDLADPLLGSRTQDSEWIVAGAEGRYGG